MVDELNLNHEQFAELEEMGALGKYAAKELGLFHLCTLEDWPSDEHELAKYLIHCWKCDDVDGNAESKVGNYSFDNTNDAEAVSYLRNTAELRAALCYWEIVKYRKHVESFTRTTTKDRHEAGIDSQRAEYKIKLIAEALEDLG